MLIDEDLVVRKAAPESGAGTRRGAQRCAAATVPTSHLPEHVEPLRFQQRWIVPGEMAHVEAQASRAAASVIDTLTMVLDALLASTFCILYSVICLRCNSVIHRTRKVIQGDDNGHVGRPRQVSPAPPCPELFCELRGLCRHSYFRPRTCGRSEKPRSSKWRGLNQGFQRNPSPARSQ